MTQEPWEFYTDFLRGPRTYEKKVAYSVSGRATKIKGVIITEASFWAGHVKLRLTVSQEGMPIYINDFEVLKGPILTAPFEYIARTVDIDIPITTKKVEKGQAELLLRVTTTMGSLRGRVVELRLETTDT